MDKPESVTMEGMLEKIFQANSTETLLLAGLGMVVWLVGANLLMAWHYRRMGKSAWSVLNPFTMPFKDLNALEWMALITLGITALALIGLALG